MRLELRLSSGLNASLKALQTALAWPDERAPRSTPTASAALMRSPSSGWRQPIALVGSYLNCEPRAIILRVSETRDAPEPGNQRDEPESETRRHKPEPETQRHEGRVRGAGQAPRWAAKQDTATARRTDEPLRRRRNLRADWTQHVIAWRLRLEGQLLWSSTAAPPSETTADAIGQIHALVWHAEELARSPRPSSPRKRFAEWWSGSRVEECRSLLQEAELRMAEFAEGGPLEGGPLYEASMANALRAAAQLDPDSEPVRRLYAIATPNEGAAP
jgi:hypothetical protein